MIDYKETDILGMVRDTLIKKLLEFIVFFEQRGISKEEVIGMILQRPRFFTHDVNITIKPICDEIDKRNNYNYGVTNEMIINNPGIFCNARKYKQAPDSPPPGGDER